MSGSRAGFKRLRRDSSLAVENALMADAEAETRDNKKALVPQEEEVRSEQAPRAASSVAAVGIRGHPGPGSLDKEAAARGAAMDEVPSHGSEIADFGGNAPSGGDGGPDVPGDARMQETENVQTFAEDQSASLMRRQGRNERVEKAWQAREWEASQKRTQARVEKARQKARQKRTQAHLEEARQKRRQARGKEASQKRRQARVEQARL